ncbi:acyl-CoA dehydrogenase family protein [Streptomyces sp. SID4956]|uniref:acyl-CoA dehydrogenase family protein n=1 Tax=Streptomyces sp. SID4956 TaxID=2690290 RepID=UPI00136A0777|nr:acyl-CoA dehydrogenase [Streptomyces sp. SID4956]
MSTAEIEKELRDALGGLLRQRCDVETVSALADGPETWDRGLWNELAAMGVPGLAVPEDQGGEGAGFALAAAAQEELGRRLAPVPTVSVLAAQAALAAADGEEAAVWLRRTATGEVRAALAVGRTADGWTPAEDVLAVSGTNGWTLDGTIPTVADAQAAGLLLVAAETGGGPALFAVDAEATGSTVAESGGRCEVTPVQGVDPTRSLGAVHLRACPGRLLAGPDRFAEVLRAAERAGLVMLAADAVGVAAEALDLAVEHAGTRRQFGRTIGSFQAISHRCADMLVAVESARALVAAAAGALDAPDPDTGTAVHLAAAEALEAAVVVTQGCVQVHGGMGFTWEHPAHRYLRRAKAAEALIALPDRLRERAAVGLLEAAA